MKNIWVISDHHWSQESILSFKDEDGNLVRPEFSNVNEMDEYMIEKWNSVVKQGDKVYHLGDIYAGDPDKFLDLRKKLNGKINLIIGNHDDIDFMIKSKAFNKVQFWRKLPEFGLLLSHLPQRLETLYHYHTSSYLKNIHGHTHQNNEYEDYHVNVSVERVNYTPVNIEELRTK